MSFEFRGFEMHGHRMWERRHVIEALDFIQTHQMTALVLHEGDLMHQLVFPRSWFDPYAQWKGAPARRGENALQNNRVYFASLLELAKSRGVEVWLEVKELAFPDEVLEAQPHVIKAGRVCPSEPVWHDFITAKTEELLADFPLLAGIILSPGSPEGRAARSQHKCQCEVCAATPLVDWYDGIIRAMHGPLAAAGKRLAVRDFAYRPTDHAPLIEAMARQAPDVIFCIKATPHDFYPTFPDNPAFGRLQRPQWIEYDTQGQFYGWGVYPCFMAEDIRARLRHAAATGADRAGCFAPNGSASTIGGRWKHSTHSTPSPRPAWRATRQLMNSPYAPSGSTPRAGRRRRRPGCSECWPRPGRSLRARCTSTTSCSPTAACSRAASAAPGGRWRPSTAWPIGRRSIAAVSIWTRRGSRR